LARAAAAATSSLNMCGGGRELYSAAVKKLMAVSGSKETHSSLAWGMMRWEVNSVGMCVCVCV
jgi:hypothetical protein